MNVLGKLRAAGAAAMMGFSTAFRETTYSGPDRANVMFFVPQDSRNYIDSWSRTLLEQKADWLWQNFGIVKEGVAGIARHTVGKGITMYIDSEDHDFASRAEDDFNEYALTPDRCDIAGRRDLYDLETFGIEQRILRGEFFAAHANNPRWNGAPCFQIFDGQQIVTPRNRADLTKPEEIVDGVRLGEFGQALEYFVRTRGQDVQPIPAALMMHWFKPHTNHQPRGITDLAQAVNPLVDIHELKRLATRCAKAQQILALFLKGVGKTKARGALGAISQAGVKADGTTPDPNSAQMEKMMGGAGGGIFYADGENADAKLITANSPSPLIEGFITDLLMRDVCLGAWGVPAEFFWNISKLNGGNTRFILAKADLFFQVLGDSLIYRILNAIAYRYLQWRIEKGKLQGTGKPWKICWQTPARVTVDNKNDGAMELQFLSNGATTLRDMHARRGENWLPATRQWFREWNKAKEIARQEGVPEAMQFWRASQPGALGAHGAEPQPAVDENGDPIKAAAT